MRRIIRCAKRYWAGKSSDTTPEYAVMLVLTIIVAIATVAVLGGQVSDSLASAEQGF